MLVWSSVTVDTVADDDLSSTAMQESYRGGTPDDMDRAVASLAENFQLLTGHTPGRQRLVTGHSRVHRLALTWPDHDNPLVCLQVLRDPPPVAEAISTARSAGWNPVDATAVAESLDLRLRFDQPKKRTTGFADWRRTTGPAYHLVLLDAGGSSLRDPELIRRCAVLEAGYVDSAGWLRFYADGQFAEGSFTRVIERTAFDVRSRLGPPSPSAHHTSVHRGMC